MKEKYVFLWGDWQPAYTLDWNISNFIIYRDYLPWNDVRNIIEVSKNGQISCFHSKGDINNDIKRGKLFLDIGFRKEFIKKLDNDIRGHWNFFRELSKADLKKAKDTELVNLLNRSMDNAAKIISFFRATQQEGTTYLVKEIEKHFTKEESSVLFMSPEADIALQEQIDWQDIIKEPVNDKILLKHAAKFPWIVMSHFTYKDAVETLKEKYNLDKKNLRFKDIRAEKEELRKRQEKILSSKDNLREIVAFAQRLNLSRMEVKSCWAGTDFYIMPLIKEIARRGGEKISSIYTYYIIDEIAGLLDGKKLSSKEIGQRKECFVMLWKNGEKEFFSGKQGIKVAREELGELFEPEEKDEIKGMIANKGKAKGTARVLHANNFEKTRILRKTFAKGEILITEMTQPNIMDIASKAGAVVTDEGGMLSHAAIISRELGIPCIVGTGHATKVFKSGDPVEVDADKGIVRKLK